MSGRTTRGKSPSRPVERTRSSSRTRRPPKAEVAEEAPPVPKKSPRRSPSRKSPARKAKDTATPNKIVAKLKEKIIEIRDSVSPDGKVEDVIRRSVSRFEEVTSDVVTSVRRYNQLGSGEQIKSALVKDKSTTDTTSLKENNVDGTAEKRLSSSDSSLAGLLVSLLIAVLLPAGVISAHIACSKERVPLTADRFLDPEVACWYVGFFLAQLVLSAIPLGPKLSCSARPTTFHYRANGLSVLVLTAAFFVGLVKYTDFRVTTLLDRSLPFLIASIGTALLVSVALHCKAVFSIGSRASNVSTGSPLRDFLLGAEVSPRIGPIDLLTTILRTGLLTVVIYNGLLIYKEVEGKLLADVSIGVLLVPVMQTLFAVDSILFQSDFTSSFTAQRCGTGLEVVLHTALFPFWITLASKHVCLSRGTCSHLVAGATATTFIAGLLLHRLASRAKAIFRQNHSSYPPSDVVLSRHAPLYRGGLWGKVRHPNYSGILLMYCSWTAVALLAAPPHWLPAAILGYTLVELIVHMTVRVEPHSSAKHGAAWNIYTSSVKCKLIPALY